MPAAYAIGKHYESFVQAQLASGRYRDASEVVRDALRLMEERERGLAALDEAVARGMTDVDASRLSDAEAVFDRLDRKYATLAAARADR